ncbi:MAG TPA: hypothetical protein GXX36_10535 [Clostridiaceae bacterium]|nr:hypothetical protein [Clostridiaceae bacterium]
MKHEKKLQRWMKDFLSERGLNPANWRYIKNTPEELVIIHKYSLKPRVIKKEREGA